MKAKKEAGATKPTATKMEDLKLKDIKLLENINQLYNQIEISLNEKGIINTAYHLTPENFNLMGRQMLQDSQTILTKVWEKLTEKKRNAFIELYRKYPFIEGENGLNIYPFGYDIFFNSHLTNHYIKTNKVTSAIDAIPNNAFKPQKDGGILPFFYQVANDNVTVELNGKDNKPIDANARDILDLINILWAEKVRNDTPREWLSIEQNRLIIIPLTRYMIHKGITDRKYSRQKLVEGVLRLEGSNIKYKLIEFETNDKGMKIRTEKSISKPIISVYRKTIYPEQQEGQEPQEAETKILIDDDIGIWLDFDFAVSLTRAKRMLHNAEINKIDSNKYPLDRKIAKKLEEIYYTAGHDIISVESLLESLPALPAYEDLKEKGTIRRKIIEPIEKSLEHLVEIGVLKEWAYYDINKRPLPDSIIGGNDRLKYNVWINLYIHFVPGADALVL